MKSVRSVEIMTAVNWHEGRRELALELFYCQGRTRTLALKIGYENCT
jgi:hypothetical protein